MSRSRLLFALLFLGLPSFGATFGTVSPDLGVADLILDEPRNKLYLINSNLNRVDVWCLGPPACPAPGRRFLAPIITGTDPLAGAMSPDGKFLYVTSYNQVSLNVIDLTKAALVQRVSLPANPEGVAVGADGRVLITTIGAGPGNSQNTLLVFDPSASQSAAITAVPIAVTAPAPPVAPPLGRTALSTRSALLATKDGSLIVGVNNISGSTRIVFVYEVSSATVLRARTVNFVSNVLSISNDGSKFMAGLTLFETSTLAVLAQQNAANAPFSFPGGNANNFNTQQNQGGSVFSPDGTVLYSGFNIAPVQNPPAKANVSRLLLNDPDNLLINLGLQLPENLAGKMVISENGGTVYALSESGFLTLPVSNIYQNPIAMTDGSTVALLSNDQCGVSPNKQVSVAVKNMGTGRMTASAQLLSLPPPTTGGLGGFGGPGGGGPGGGIVIIIPIVIGAGAPNGVQAANGFGPANTGVLQTSPLLQTQPTGAGANFTFRYNPVNAKTQGTVSPHNFLIQSPEAINIPPNVQIFQNNHDSDARGQVMPLAVNAASNEGLFDMVSDNARQRLYVANSGMNRVEVFDMRAQQFLTPIKVGQLPHSLAIGTDGITLYVANSGGETISVVDLDKGAQTGLIRFTPLPFNSNAALVTPNLIAAGLQGPQVVMSNGSLWRVVGNQVLPRKLNTAVFGTSTTLPGPSQTIASTPGGEYIFLLAGNGNGYLYDASVDDWVAERQLFTANTNTTNLPDMTGYYGPIAAGPGGQYFLANGVIFNQSLTEIGSVPTPATVGPVTGGPTRGGTNPTAPPVAAVAAAGARTFIRFSQPNAIAQTGGSNTVVSLPGGPGGPAGGLPGLPLTFTVPTIEVVDVATGNTMLTGPALEGPLAKVNGNQTQRVSGRTLAMDPSGNMAYALTTSGLSVIPLTPIAPSDRPVVSQNGVVSIANLQPSLAPGNLAAINGKNLASSGTSGSGSLPTVLGGSCVTLNNVPLPLIATSDGQVNVQIPVELAAGTYPLVVRSIDRQAASLTSSVKLAKVAPAVFVDNNGQASIYHSDGSLVTKDNPTTRDQKLSIYATGLGVTKGGKVTSGNPAPSSPLAVTDKVQVYFGNPSLKQSEVIVRWSGLVPGMVGVNRIDVTVPGFHTEGDALPVTIKIDGVSSSTKGPTAPVTYSH
jgi:uncharacterized protein (TIGR03437 family)